MSILKFKSKSGNKADVDISFFKIMKEKDRRKARKMAEKISYHYSGTVSEGLDINMIRFK